MAIEYLALVILYSQVYCDSKQKAGYPSWAFFAPYLEIIR